ncbi:MULTISPECIES: Ig-like domain-containing protein [Aerococcus]|uniref:Gram-positive cocci surface proteins LPxTG domain-containing protein n=2 Tax=Aerococcus TaxID=1375 RepID=A0A329NVJ1_9LACT|nr:MULTISPECIES: Ig-like domain-containing protein [Aerococcus]MCY3035111.1 Ig-like domain-containing protein [Aerococcus mictus]MCY3071352.1 Ig-like domain-containing protein [Aerococcus mictus]MCY3087182.1 Ig-like domain-containing protein [Aerococcus mictus]MCY3088848.1 Ig-like domain-containing protein [Aerococcus mictus]MDK6597640.1 Ig-like domain-containing protein [Aerococcus urinae]
MVGKNNFQVKKEKQSNKFYRYSIKRLSVGVASVAVAAGLLFMGDAAVVQAAAVEEATVSEEVEPVAKEESPVVEEIPVNEEAKEIEKFSTSGETTSEEAETSITSESSENLPEEANDVAPENLKEASPSSENRVVSYSAPVENQPEAETTASDSPEVNATNPEASVSGEDATSNAVTNEDSESEPSISSTTENDERPNTSARSVDINEVEDNAIYSPGQKGDKQSYSGTVYVYRHNSLADVGDETLPGVNVYLQWVDSDGYVSNVYKTTSRPDGTFTFNFQQPEVDQFGNVHHFQLAGNGDFAIRTWVENPNPEKYNIVKPGDQKYGFHTRLSRTNETWDFTAGINRIVDGQVALQEKILMNDWLVKPRDQWTTSPNQDGIWPKVGNYGTVRGNVWYENGDPMGSVAAGWKKDSWDVNATGTKVVASYVNDEVARRFDAWKEANPNAGLEDFRAAQENIIREYEAENGTGSHIAETVVGTVDSDGEYYIPFRGLYGISPYQQNSGTRISYTISDEEYGQLVRDEDVNHSNLMQWNGTIGQKHRHINTDYMYVAPLIDNYAIWGNTSQNNMFAPLTNSAIAPILVNNLASDNISNVNFAALAAQPLHDIKKFDNQNNFAKPGQEVQNETAGLLPNQQYKVRWFKDGKAIGEATVVNSNEVGRIGSIPMTVPADLAAPANYSSAVFYGNSDADDLSEALAADSFIAAPGVNYHPIEVTAGEEAKTDTPKFTDKDGNEYEPNYQGQRAPKYEYVERIVTTDSNDQIRVEYKPLETVNVDGQDIQVSVDPNTGVVTVPASETAKLKPGQKVVVPVSVAFDNGLRLSADAEITIKDDRQDQDKFQPNYVPEEAEFGKNFTGQQPNFKQVDLEGKETDVDFSNVPLSKDPAKPAFSITTPTNGATINPETGVITIPAEETSKVPGQTIEVPVTVTYEDGTTDQVTAQVNVTAPDVIDRSEDPNAPVPQGYHKVDFKAGEGVASLSENKVYHVKDGAVLTADHYPTAQPAEGYENPTWDVQPGTAIKADQTITATATKTVVPDTTAPTITVSAKDIQATEGQAIDPVSVTTDDPEATVTVDGLPEGLTYNPETKQIEGTVPEGTVQWADDQDESRDFPATVKAIDPAGNEASEPINVTVLRDTDGDGQADKNDEDDDNDGIPDKDDDASKVWDGLDAKTTDTTATNGQEVPANTKVVTPNKPGAKVTTPTPVDGLSVDENGNLVGTPNVDFQPGESEKVVEIPVEISSTGTGQKDSQGQPTDEAIQRTVKVTVTNPNPAETPAESSVEVTPKSQNALEGKDITPVTPQADNVPEGGSVKVTIDGQDTYPGLTVDPESGQVTGQPEITDWAPEEETRTITVTAEVQDKDGNPVRDGDGNPVKAESTITIYRDTDKDGQPDKDTGMPQDPNNPSVPGINQGDKDDDNDGWTDQDEKDRGTDPKDETDFPQVTEPDAENEPGKDTTTVTGKTTPNTDVEVKDKDGNTIGTGTSDENGKVTIDVPKQNPGDKVTITPGKKDDQGNFKPVTDDQGKPQGGAETVVKETPQITNPGAKNDPDSDQTKVTGKTTVPNSTVEVKDKDGNTIGTGTSDENGDFTIDVPRQNPGDKVSVIPSKDYTNPDGSTETRTGDPVETTVTEDAPAVVSVEVTPKSQNALEGKDITPVTPQADNVPEGGSVKVTIDGKDTYPGLTVDPETGQVTGQPQITDWAPEEETRTITVEVSVLDKDGKPVTDTDGNPVTAESTITVYRDTDKDGQPDKDTGMPQDPNNPNVPGIDQGDKDDDNDGWTDKEEKDRGTDPKNEDSFPRVTEPGAENQPGQDTTTVTGKTTPNTDVEVKDKDGNTIGTGTSDEDGNIKIDVPKQNPGDKISIVPGKKDDQGNFKPVKDDNGNPQGGAETVVKETPQITNPGAKNEPDSDKTTVTGKTTVPNTTIEVKDKDGNTIGTGTSDDNGDFTIEVPRQGNGDTITIIPSKDYTNPDGTVETRTGDPVKTTVTSTGRPSVKQDKDIYEPEYQPGSGQPGDKVEIGEPIFRDEDGKVVNPPAGTSFQPGAGETGITVDPETGHVTVDVPADAKPGDKIEKSVTVTYPDGSSETVTVTVTVEEKDGSGVTPVPTPQPQPEPQPEEQPEVEDEVRPDPEPESNDDPVKADDKTVSVKTQTPAKEDKSKTQAAPAQVHTQLPQTGAVAGLANSLALALIGTGSILALGKKKKED